VEEEEGGGGGKQTTHWGNGQKKHNLNPKK